MTIQICPIKGLYRILARESPDRSGAIISSASELDWEKLRGIACVFRRYEDLDCEWEGRSFSREDAAAFADYIKGLESGIDTLYCCCDAGESRSPAVAAAVMRYFHMDDMPLWRNPRYKPNMLVFELLTDALGPAISEAELELRFYTNQNAFRDAIRRQYSLPR